MKIRIKNKTLALLATVSLGFGLTTMTSIVSAEVAYPAQPHIRLLMNGIMV